MISLGAGLTQVPWTEKLRRTLARRRGARLGEATVVSRQVHVSDPAIPQTITVITTADAGQAFYGRAEPGEIIHLDIFHELANVDHHRVAAALQQALAGEPLQGSAPHAGLLLDHFDLVTATGGGCVTGRLQSGRKESLRAAHRNHLHLAGLLREDQLHLLLPLVIAAEEEMRAQGIEIRRIERLRHVNWSGGSPMDLSHYTDEESDSRLKGPGAAQGGRPGRAPAEAGRAAGHAASHAASRDASHAASHAASRDASHAASGATGGAAGRAPFSDRYGATHPGGASAAQSMGAPPAQSLRHTRGASLGESTPGPAMPGRAAAAGPGAGLTAAGQSGEGSPQAPASEAAPPDPLLQEQRMQEALDLSRRLGSPDELKRVLDELALEQGWASLYGSGSSQAPFIVRLLETEGLVRREIRGLRLTDAGKELAHYLSRHLRDLKLRFRKLIRRIPAGGRSKGRRADSARSAPSPDVRYGPVTGSMRAPAGSWLGDLAVPETIRAALTRTRLERAPCLRLERSDIHVNLRSGEQPLHICLLIDASASMAGRRILAAKHLARHLLASTRDRIAVVSFQERDVRVHVPFTRDYTLVEEGLSRIQPLGLTPLAHGLTSSLELIKHSRVRRPLLLLITDGIPTVPKWSIDPLADAMEAARQVGAGRVPFGCIGLQPSRRYLEELTRAAGGALHVVEELDEDALVTIAHRERLRTAQRGRAPARRG